MNQENSTSGPDGEFYQNGGQVVYVSVLIV